MKKETLCEMLKCAGYKKDRSTTYTLEDCEVALLVNVGSHLISIDQATCIAVKNTHIEIKSGRNAQYYLEIEHIVGLRAGSPKNGGLGFSP